MKICLYLLLLMLHFTAGCHLSEDESRVTGYTGGSVLLPCVCADPQSAVKTFTWHYDRQEQNEVFQNEKYNGRLKLFNENSPTNLSLLISDLRKEDEGLYRCEIPFSHYRDISLTIKGCELVRNKQTEMTAHLGESVALPCYCKELQAKPEQLKWAHYQLNLPAIFKTIYSTVQSQRERDLAGFKLINENVPGNLSLFISDLTSDHQGVYRCSVKSQNVDIKLNVEGCELVQNKQKVDVTARSGESVVLPCYCNDLTDKPEQLTWTYHLQNLPAKNKILYSTDLGESEGDFTKTKFLNENFPGNLSLLISDLTSKHQGVYRCSVESQYVDIKLDVEGCELVKNKQKVDVTARSGESIVLPCYCNDPKDKPEQLTWTHLNNTSKTIYSIDQSQNERNLPGIKLLNENFRKIPGNLSLLISDLTHEHQGVYRCSIGSQYVDINLVVKGLLNSEEEKWNLQTICLSTHELNKQTEEISTEQSEQSST